MDGLDETRPLLAPPPQDAASSTLTTSPGMGEKKKRTPLPKLQIGIVMLLHLSEPMSAHCIFPFINQVGRFLVTPAQASSNPDPSITAH